MTNAVNDRGTDDPVRVAACRMYDAECALHAAHQTHEDSWVAAADAKLHVAIAEYLKAMSGEA